VRLEQLPLIFSRYDMSEPRHDKVAEMKPDIFSCEDVAQIPKILTLAAPVIRQNLANLGAAEQVLVLREEILDRELPAREPSGEDVVKEHLVEERDV
jgi:hypothetical protein